MKNSSNGNYICPICLAFQKIENDNTLLKQADLVYQDDLASIWINSFWIGKNKGHVIIVPNKHYSSIYDLPKNIGHRIFDISQKISIAIKKTYNCDGITIRQNNESAGDQHAFHYHLHIFPRYKNDDFNKELAKESVLSNPEERRFYVKKLKDFLNK